jgi:hypothetical protein
MHFVPFAVDATTIVQALAYISSTAITAWGAFAVLLVCGLVVVAPAEPEPSVRRRARR